MDKNMENKNNNKSTGRKMANFLLQVGRNAITSTASLTIIPREFQPKPFGITAAISQYNLVQKVSQLSVLTEDNKDLVSKCRLAMLPKRDE